MRYRLLAAVMAGLLGVMLLPSVVSAQALGSNTPDETSSAPTFLDSTYEPSGGSIQILFSQHKSKKNRKSKHKQTNSCSTASGSGTRETNNLPTTLPGLATTTHSENAFASTAYPEVEQGMDAALQAGEHADQSGEDATSEIAQAAQPYLNQAMVVDANSPQAFARDVRRVIDGEQPSSSQNEDSPIYGGNQDHLSALTKNINSDGGGCGGCNRINTNSGRQNNLLLQCADKQSAETQRTSLIIRQIAGLIMQLCQTSPGYCNAPGGQKGTIGGPIQISNIDSPGLPSGTFTPLPTTIGQGGLGENIALPPPPSTSDQSGLGGSSSLPPLPSPNGGSLPSLARVVMTPDTTA